MNILLREDLPNFRYAVGKLIFLYTYSDYRLVEDIKNTNLMVVEKNNVVEFVSLFRKPTGMIDNNYPVTIYYENNRSMPVQNRENQDYKKEQFSEEFNQLYDRYLEIAFMKTKDFLNKFDDKYDMISTYFNKSISEISNTTTFYKYYNSSSCEKISTKLMMVNYILLILLRLTIHLIVIVLLQIKSA